MTAFPFLSLLPGADAHFQIAGDDLVYIEEYSSNFTFVKVKNGERFHGAADALSVVLTFYTANYDSVFIAYFRFV